jgi:hypothetical protein
MASSETLLLALAVLIPGSEQKLKAIRYEIAVDAPMNAMTVKVCFDGAPPEDLEAGEDEARPYLKRAVLLAGGKEARLAIERDGVVMPRSLTSEGCVRLEIDLSAARESGDRDVASQVGQEAMILSPDLFLWQPNDIPDDVEVTAGFRLPKGVSVTTPWIRLPAEGGLDPRYRLPPSTFVWHAMMTLGRFPTEELHVRGATLTVARLSRPMKASRQGVLRWLKAAGDAVAGLYGVFPVQRAEVIVDPVGGDGIEFGYVERGGGANVLFLIGTDAEDGELPGEWVAVHEFSHLALPFVARDDCWLSEGFATYYQEVLRARAGLRTPRHAWQQLYEGFERGRRQKTHGRSLAQTSARMGWDNKFQRVYWSGAAIALLADVQLRTMPGGKLSLDRAIQGLRRCCLQDAHLYSASEIFAILDRESGTHVFKDLYDRWTPSTEFPDLRATFKNLGIVEQNDEIRLDNTAPFSRVRDAIVSPHPPQASGKDLTVP